MFFFFFRGGTAGFPSSEYFFLLFFFEYILSLFMLLNTSKDLLHLLDHLILVHFPQLSISLLPSNYQTFWAVFILGQVSNISTPVPKSFKQVVSRRLILLFFWIMSSSSPPVILPKLLS